MIERACEGGGVALRLAGHDRFGGEPGRDERFVHPIARKRIDEAGGITDQDDPGARGCRGTDPAHRELMAAEVGDRVRVDRVRACEPRKMITEAGSLAGPPSHAEIRVIALREQPAVAAGRRPDLDDGRRSKASLVEQRPGNVPFEGDAAVDARVESRGFCDRAVRGFSECLFAGLDGFF